MKKHRIVVVDDDPNVLKVLKKILLNAGYECISVSDGESAIKESLESPPDLIILDRMFPGMDGIELSCEIKRTPALAQVPILMLTAACSLEDKISALETCVDDYFCKPFSADELLAKIRAILRHSSRSRDSNPTTNLPGGNALEEEIDRRIHRGDTFALMHIDIDNFKAYADAYGFNSANRMIKLCGDILLEAARSRGSRDIFLSHIGGDDFIIVTAIDQYEPLAKAITEIFDREVVHCFNEEDSTRRSFASVSRKGRKGEYPLTTISIGIISNEHVTFHDATETSASLARAKNRELNAPAKSSYFFLEL